MLQMKRDENKQQFTLGEAAQTTNTVKELQVLSRMEKKPSLSQYEELVAIQTAFYTLDCAQ